MLNATSEPTVSVARDHRLGAKIEDRDRGQLRHELDQMAAPIGELGHIEADAGIAREQLLPAVAHLRLDRHRFERADAGDAFDQEGLVFRAAPEFLFEQVAQRRRDEHRDRDIERDRQAARSASASANT